MIGKSQPRPAKLSSGKPPPHKAGWHHAPVPAHMYLSADTKPGCPFSGFCDTSTSESIAMFFTALLSLLQLSPPAFAQSVWSQFNFSAAHNATEFALIYGYPLLSWQRYASDVIDDVGINAFRHARELSTPANRSVVKPNVDTLYSTVVYDLSDTNVAINVPDVPADSFKLFSFYDPYGVNWANFGTGGELFRNGSYLLQSGTGEEAFQVTNGSDYIAELNAPSPYGTLLVRWGVNATNEDTVHEYQDATTVEEVAQSGDVFSLEMPLSLQTLIDARGEYNLTIQDLLNLVALYEKSNTDTKLALGLEAAGIKDGKYTPQYTRLILPNITATEKIEAAARQNAHTLNNGWSLIDPELIGTYGDDYALRAAVAWAGYLALTYPEAVYPNLRSGSSADASGAFDLGGDEALMFTFSGKPPLQQAGFWSLTAYGGDYFLIPNDMETYALGDRSNITYPDESPVYGAEVDANQDESFQILVQPADVKPPSNWTRNWLPAPSGGGSVIPQLRFFAADEDALEHYEYPAVTRMAAITEDGGSSGGNGTEIGTGSGNGTQSPPSATAGGGSTSASASASVPAQLNDAMGACGQVWRLSLFGCAVVAIALVL